MIGRGVMLRRPGGEGWGGGGGGCWDEEEEGGCWKWGWEGG